MNHKAPRAISTLLAYGSQNVQPPLPNATIPATPTAGTEAAPTAFQYDWDPSSLTSAPSQSSGPVPPEAGLLVVFRSGMCILLCEWLSRPRATDERQSLLRKRLRSLSEQRRGDSLSRALLLASKGESPIRGGWRFHTYDVVFLRFEGTRMCGSPAVSERRNSLRLRATLPTSARRS